MTARLWTRGEPIHVDCDGDGRPLRFAWQTKTHVVDRICNRWRVSAEWWRAEPAAWREYIKLVTRDGLLCLVARDLDREGWWMIRLYD